MKFKFIFLIIISVVFYSLLFSSAFASETSGTINSGGNIGYAWSDQTGWVNFGTTNGNINITDNGIVGYAWNDNYGWINMSPTNGGVTVSASGALSGYAWGSSLGWINLSGVSINSSGRFVGTASGANVGTLTFDCANCSVVTDFKAQNFRTVAPAPITMVSSGGGGGGSGILYVFGSNGQAVPAHIDAYNVSLEIDNDRQSGILTQSFAGDLSVGIDVPQRSIGGHIIVNVEAIAINPSIITTATRIISGALFDITATDNNGKLIHSFASPIRIALKVPEELQGRNDIGVYFFNEENELWERVPNAQFDGNIARFYVDHLTLFGIFSNSALPNILASFFTSLSAESVESASIVGEEAIGVFAEGEIPKELEETLPAQLFDINLEIENQRITDIKDLVARIIFTSFGRVPTPVDLFFDILDKDGKKVYSATDKITVETQAVLTKRFNDVSDILEKGNYTLLATTLYNTSVKDEFKQKFEIVGVEEVKISFWKSMWFWLITTIVFIFIFIFAIRKVKQS